MDIYSLIIIVAILAVVIIVVTRPLFKSPSEQEVTVDTTDNSSIKNDYDEILNRIRELDFEYKLGKIPASDYAALREELKNQAAGLRQSASATESKKDTLE